MSSPLWVDPSSIRFKISPHFDLRGVVGGDWDIERRYPLETNVKHLAIVQRYAEGRRWEDTDLFRDIYARRLAGGGHVRGEASIEALAAQYYDRVDGMFRDMEVNGFRIESPKGKKYPLPALMMGRDGDVFLGNQGNHRVAMARVIGLSQIAGEIVCRHRQVP